MLVNKTEYHVDEAPRLKQMFEEIISKEGEPIVLKRKEP